MFKCAGAFFFYADALSKFTGAFFLFADAMFKCAGAFFLCADALSNHADALTRNAVGFTGKIPPKSHIYHLLKSPLFPAFVPCKMLGFFDNPAKS